MIFRGGKFEFGVKYNLPLWYGILILNFTMLQPTLSRNTRGNSKKLNTFSAYSFENILNDRTAVTEL